jgi:hypothetical protein
MPRSGTSLIFGAFAAHGDLSWFSRYEQRFPAVPALAALGRIPDLAASTRKAVPRYGDARPLVDRLRIAPTEAYAVWKRCFGERFLYDYLLDVSPTLEQAACARRRVHISTTLQGKPRFAAKLTGPGRIGFLSSAFPDAQFIHILRDPRAVVDSLMRIPFWRTTSRLHEPAWEGGLAEDEIDAWQRAGTPEMLAAAQWGAVLRTIREEASRRDPALYLEVRYEAFLQDPHHTLDSMFDFAGLRRDAKAHVFVDERLNLRDLSRGWEKRLAADQVAAISSLLAGPMAGLAYDD